MASDARCRAPSHPRRAWMLRGARPASTTASSKATACPDPSAFRRRRSPRRRPGRARLREPDFGQRVTKERRSFASCALQRSPFGTERLDRRFRGDGQAPLVDFCNQNSPRARPRDRSIPGRRRGGCPPLRPPDDVALRSRTSPKARHDLPATPAEVSRVRGRDGFRTPGAFRRDCSRRKLRPNPIGSDTSRHELVATPAGESSDAGATRDGPSYELTGRVSLARSPPRSE
jgi:hypothetical protein